MAIIRRDDSRQQFTIKRVAPKTYEELRQTFPAGMPPTAPALAAMLLEHGIKYADIKEDYMRHWKFVMETQRSITAPVVEQLIELEMMLQDEESA